MVVTRPSPRNQQLCDLIIRAGGRAIGFPTIEVKGIPNQGGQVDRLKRIGDVDWYIFISVNAVEFGTPMLDQQGIDRRTIQCASMGPTTSQALRLRGFDVDIECPAPLSSEMLLSRFNPQKINGSQIAIFRGIGGRERLRQGLESLGANVSYIECYQRLCPDADAGVLLNAQAPENPNVVVITSVDGLTNFMDLAKGAGGTALFGLDLVVAGKRQQDHARSLDWAGRIFRADDAGDDAILRVLKEVAQS